MFILAWSYLAHGTATDYMYDALRVTMAFTWEIYGDMTQPEGDCFQMFNPATASKFEKVLSKWSSSFLTLLVNLPRSLHGLTNRSLVLEFWDWEFWPVSAVPVIPDLLLRKRFSVPADPLLFVEDWEATKWGKERGLETGIAKQEEVRPIFEFLFLLARVLLFWMFFRLCRCCFCTCTRQWFGPLCDRGRPVPV